MKKLFMLMAALVMTQMAVAIPAKRVTRTVQQPDGTTLEVTLRGDETFHFYTTSDGTPVREDASGRWVPDLRDINKIWTERAQKREAKRRPHAQKMQKLLQDMSRQRARRVKAAPNADPQEEGYKKKGLLILVNFKDKKLITSDAKVQAIYGQLLNSEGNPYGQNHGSVHEYFLDQSYGDLHVSFDIAGPITTKNNMSYYGENDSQGDDKHPEEMIVEALKAVDDVIDFRNYDWDGDGEVENVYVIYAGYGEAGGGAKNTIWPHQWQLSETSNSLMLDGVRLDTYACGSELLGGSGSTLDGIGTMCHEYSHCLGLPDFYDTSSEGSNFGMSAWSIMDYGCYNDDGYCPAGYTAYERMYSGWLEPTELNMKASITDMKAIEDTAQAYIIYNDANHNEYYLLANHQLKGWDEAANGHGMLVLHVDYDRSAWENNTVNNTTSRQRMTPIPADGKLTNYTSNSLSSYNAWIKGLAGDPFPGTSKNAELTDESSTKATLYNKNTDGTKFMHKPITHIAETDGLISFEFMKGNTVVDSPTPDDEVTNVEKRSFVASWSEVEDAQSYNLRYRSVTVTETEDDDDILTYCAMFEDFENFFADNDGNQDISSKLDTYTYYPGWTGSKVFQGVNGAKLGNSSVGGSLTTPLMDDLTSGRLSMYLSIFSWVNSAGRADQATIEVVLLDANGRELDVVTTEPDDESIIEVQFDNVPSEAAICIRSNGSKSRFYLSFLLVADGDMDVLDAIYEYLMYSSDDEEGDDDDEFDWNDFWNDFFVKNKATLRQNMAAHPRQIRRNATKTIYGEWVEIDGITSTQYTVTGLEYAGLYEYQVQAVDAEGNESSWSASKLVQLAGTLGIETANGSRWINGKCYDLSGRPVNPTKPGLYIRDGKTVLIK